MFIEEINLSKSGLLTRWRVLLLLFLILCVSCSTLPRYNSKDLTVLPCEYKKRFFFPIEYDKDGQNVFKDQIRKISQHIKDKKPTKIYYFIHGWDKTAASAESDYQDLICRFYHNVSRETPLETNSIVIGVFWDSTIFSDHSDPLLLKWATYFSIRNRAEILAKTGFQELFKLLQEILEPPTEENLELVLIGHSFGGRIIIKGLLEHFSTINRARFTVLSKIKEIRVVLLNAAVSEYDILAESFWHIDVDASDMKPALDRIFSSPQNASQGPSVNQRNIGIRLLWQPSIIGLGFLTEFRLYNVFSERDYANRYLFPLGAIFNYDKIECAIGACGMSFFQTLRVDSGGHLSDQPNLKKQMSTM